MFLKELNLLILCHKFPSWFVLVGTLMESDMALITAGYNAYLGEFNLVRLILVMLIITVCTNQLFFFIGKKYKNKIEDFMEEKKEHFIAKKIQKVYEYFHKYKNFIGVIFRFLVSVRILTPFILGTTSMDHKKFFILNIIGGFIWVVSICGGGYVLAHYCGYNTALKIFYYLPICGVLITIFFLIKSLL